MAGAKGAEPPFKIALPPNHFGCGLAALGLIESKNIQAVPAFFLLNSDS